MSINTSASRVRALETVGSTAERNHTPESRSPTQTQSFGAFNPGRNAQPHVFPDNEYEPCGQNHGQSDGSEAVDECKTIDAAVMVCSGEMDAADQQEQHDDHDEDHLGRN